MPSLKRLQKAPEKPSNFHGNELFILLKYVKWGHDNGIFFIFIVFLEKINDMIRNVLLMLLVVSVLSCKKETPNDDTVYRWKRELYRGLVNNEGPAFVPMFYGMPVNSNGIVSSSNSNGIINTLQAIHVRTDYVSLTEAQVNSQRDSIYKASGRMFAFKYVKVKNR